VRRKKGIVRVIHSFSPHFHIFWFAAIVLLLNIMTTIHAFFQVIAACILFLAPLEAFVLLPHYGGAKMGLLPLGAMRIIKKVARNRHDDNDDIWTKAAIPIPENILYGNAKADRSLLVTSNPAETATTPPPPPRTATTTSDMMTLTSFLQGQPLESVFESIQMACRDISTLVHQASFGSNHPHFDSIGGLHDGGGSMNVQGEEQKKLDVMANDIMKQALAQAGTVRLLVSEEEEEPISLKRTCKSKLASDGTSEKSYIVAFDPLDGSSNIDVGIPVGTIFGIFEHNGDGEDVDDDVDDSDVLQAGKQLVAAGYWYVRVPDRHKWVDDG
jgi:Fructose-1-6-bisphosphatase, N-terminal domain